MEDASDDEEDDVPPHLTLVVESGPDSGASIVVSSKTVVHRHPGPKANSR